jgi:hypothetical protein
MDFEAWCSSLPYKGKKSGAFQKKWLRHAKSLKRDALKWRDRGLPATAAGDHGLWSES